MAKYSLDQLRSKVWSKAEQAKRDLKDSKVPERGPDYELRQGATGWQLMSPLEKPTPPKTEEKGREQRVIDSLRKKPGAKPAGEATVIAFAKKEATKVAPPPPPKPVEPPATPPAPPPPPEKPKFDLSPAPADGGPYELILREGEGFAKHSSILSALDVSRKLKCAVHVRSKTGEIIRTIDAALIKAHEVATRKASGTPRKGVPRDPSKPSKFSRAIALLSRPNGATAAELEKAIGWERVGQRHVNRACVMTKAKYEVLGDKHWRLLMPKS
jgi:hypothetical protein